MPKRIFAAMSGGVDSAAAALLLLQAGYEVTGVTMRLHAFKDRPGLCGSADDIDTAKAVAGALGIPHVVLDLSQQFRRQVMDRFVWAYTHGRTPNPCIDCNREIKFGALLDWALDQGADAIATGHYAKVRFCGETGRWQLLRGVDRRKDQTYFLYQLTQHQLAHLVLPVGDYEKPALRALAEAHGLVNARKADSQDICFVPDGDYVAFLRQYGGESSGTSSGAGVLHHRPAEGTGGQRGRPAVCLEEGFGARCHRPGRGPPALYPGADGGAGELALGPGTLRPPAGDGKDPVQPE